MINWHAILFTSCSHTLAPVFSCEVILWKARRSSNSRCISSREWNLFYNEFDRLFFFPIILSLSLSSTVFLGALSTCVTLVTSPIFIAICKKKSLRLTAILGGLVTALGCLFTSFATQFHQLFFSFSIVMALGVSMINIPAVMIVGSYFKKRRALVEIALHCSQGLGFAFMPLFLTFCIR